ncbi:MAG: 23S rRNA (adenine(2503)-C(2))-methyltransferase RlmN [Deltaproteobacteria bacterium]|nr:23S rRNA (adenine(2503)-C(2))-methyltransferase RlmN [Deltaproteobacteria bacterium]
MNRTAHGLDNFFQFTYEELQLWGQSNHLSSFTAAQLFKDFYKHALMAPRWQRISIRAKQLLEQSFSFDLPGPAHVHQASDNTVKFLFTLEDGQSVEAVLIPFNQKYTLCISSQVGCAMGCTFCHTGTQGLIRNLRASEIAGQYIRAKQWLIQHRKNNAGITNVVFMGQGEPLHNFDEVKRACHILLARRGASLAEYKITVSTCGYMPGLVRWQTEMPNVNIALSLHAPDDIRRTQLIPINRAYPLTEVLREMDAIPLGKKRYITFEYLLIDRFNDSDEDALAIGELLKSSPAIFNIIPFNPYPGAQYQRPSADRTTRFAAIVSRFGFPVTVRATKGTDILAACGQLKSITTHGIEAG